MERKNHSLPTTVNLPDDYHVDQKSTCVVLRAKGHNQYKRAEKASSREEENPGESYG